MKASAVIVLVAVVVFSVVMALVPAAAPHSALAANPSEVAGGRITIVKEGQLICVSNAISVATFRVEDNGMLRMIDVDMLPNLEMANGPENAHLYKSIFGADP